MMMVTTVKILVIKLFLNFDEYRIKQKLMQLYSGDYVLVWGEPDEDGWGSPHYSKYDWFDWQMKNYESTLSRKQLLMSRYVEGELLDGRRGLIPSNYVTKLVSWCC